jgi:hypothetical protein
MFKMELVTKRVMVISKMMVMVTMRGMRLMVISMRVMTLMG